MESWELNGYTLEYDDDLHVYLVDGVIVLSVTQVLGVKFGNKYSNVSPEVLRRAGTRGTKVHKDIEDYCTKGINIGSKEVNNFRFLKQYYDFDVIKNEIPVIISKDGVALCAGRLDMIIDLHGERAVADIKTTSTLDKEYLAYQLNLYRLGVLECYPELGDITTLYGIHIREDKRKLAPIPVNESIAWDILEKYESEAENGV